jgi:uncharacterized membrane protein (TIGR02234 family)
MNYRKFKSYSLLSSFVLSALILIGWSQTWFLLTVTFPTENSDGIAVTGQDASPALSALGLAGFALTAALALSSITIRRILGVLLVLLGTVVVVISITAWSNPIVSASSLLTALSAISDLDTLRTFVVSSSTTFWPAVTTVAGVLLAFVGSVVVFTAGKWSTGSRKFDRVTSAGIEKASGRPQGPSQTGIVDKSATNIDAWDSLSHGTDPTIN